MEPWLTPVLSADEMRAVDAWAIKDQGVPGLDLMEAAGRAVAEAAEEVSPSGRAVVVCGKGNNGGDGLVAARYLREMGHDVDAVLLWRAGDLSGDARANLDRTEAREVSGAELKQALDGAGVVIDAIFGTGFSGEPRDPAAAAIEAINDAAAPVVAADVASGVNASNGEIDGAAVEADATVSFHSPKVGHWISPGKVRGGRLPSPPGPV
jgi:NAD(P)H-hydrate epimerase